MRKNWPTVRLSEVLAERREIPSDDDLLSGNVRIVEKIGFNEGRIKLRTDSETKTGMILIRPGDLVVSGINAAKGAIAIHDEGNVRPVAATIHYGAYIPNRNRVEVKFLWWMLRSRFFRDLLLEYVPGGIKTELKAKRLLPVPVPLPPLAEQRRIVARIEELAAKIEEAHGLRQRALDFEIPALRNLVFRSLFQFHPETESFGAWPMTLLDDLCLVITDGTHQTPRYVDEGMPFLSAQNVKPYRFMPEIHRKVSLDDYVGYTRHIKPEKGDVLMTRVGAMIGEAAMIDRNLDFAFYVSLCLMKPRKDRVHAPYLVHWLNSPFGVAAAKEKTLGKGHSQGNLNLKLIREFRLPLPSLEEQIRLTARLDEIQAGVNAIRGLQLQTAAELDALMPSILDRAFRGEL